MKCSSDQRQPSSSPTNKQTLVKSLPERPHKLQVSKRLVPSIDVSVQQTLNEHTVAPLLIEKKSNQNSAAKIYASEPHASYYMPSSAARSTLKFDFNSTRTVADESSGSRNVRISLYNFVVISRAYNFLLIYSHRIYVTSNEISHQIGRAHV